jgi:DNA-directed RNA polymerase specialized sigma24 family protein
MKHIKNFEDIDLTRADTEDLIQGAYIDYINANDIKANKDSKKWVLRSIKRQARSMIRNKETDISVWKEKFKNEPEVLAILDEIEMEQNINKYNL